MKNTASTHHSQAVFVCLSHGRFLGGVVVYLVDGRNQRGACFLVKELHKRNRFIKRRLHEHLWTFHVAVNFNMGDDFVHKINLALVEGLVVDKLRECRHGGVVVELGNLANQQAKRCIAVFTFIVFFASQLAGKHTFQFLVIATARGILWVSL